MPASEPDVRDLLRLPDGPLHLAALPARATPGFEGGKGAGKAALADLAGPLGELQERLYAEGSAGGGRSVLLVLQGMDTSGKGGVMRHVAGLVDPQGLHLTAFKAPTAEELAHDFLWRVTRELPAAGSLGVFDRSHYEDVVATRVRGLVDEERVERRCEAITGFEQRLVDEGTVVVKCFLHLSADEQLSRLTKRLDRPDKHWKFSPGDVEDRALWSAYQRAYEVALERTDTEAAPWYVVPADRKWYRNWAVAHLLLATLRDLDPRWPDAGFDVEEQRRRLEQLGDVGAAPGEGG